VADRRQKVLFVGPVSGYSSYPVVCKGLIGALVKSGIDVFVADTTWDGSVDHTVVGGEYAENINYLDRMDVSQIISSGIFTKDSDNICVAINPTHHMMAIRSSGFKVAGMFIGDVDVIPESWKAVMNQQDLVLAPSSWVKKVSVDSGVVPEVLVVNHGVSEGFYPSTKTTESLPGINEPFVFLHLCSSIFFPQRKSTPQVIEAFDKLVKDGRNAVLRLVFNMNTKPVRALVASIPKGAAKDRVQVYYHEGSRPVENMRASYLASHAGVFPSRAEGFGIIPLEMRSCGVPVVQTMCTGHADHVMSTVDLASSGIVPVKHGPMVPAWGSFGMAPEVTSESIYEAMKQCMDTWPQLKQAAMNKAEYTRQRWDWTFVTQPLVTWIHEQEQNSQLPSP
jgi:glycosyltransferase involved in cell wall biosynthesis